MLTVSTISRLRLLVADRIYRLQAALVWCTCKHPPPLPLTPPSPPIPPPLTSPPHPPYPTLTSPPHLRTCPPLPPPLYPQGKGGRLRAIHERPSKIVRNLFFGCFVAYGSLLLPYLGCSYNYLHYYLQTSLSHVLGLVAWSAVFTKLAHTPCAQIPLGQHPDHISQILAQSFVAVATHNNKTNPSKNSNHSA